MSKTALSSSAARGAAILGIILAFAGGYVVRAFTHAERPDAWQVHAAMMAKRAELPVGSSPARGPADALVTIVEFADFQCGQCAGQSKRERRLLARYGDRVRWVFKQFPLRSHPHGKAAALASLAAHDQGKFWEYHDQLFQRQPQLGPAMFEELARELGLDLARFRSALKGRVLPRIIAEEQQLGWSVGVQGTPTLFVNGRQMVGIPSYGELEALVREELLYAAHLLQQGARRDDLYASILRGASERASSAAATPGAAGQPAPPERGPGVEPGLIYKVNIGESPALVDSTALVTAVAFVDLQCENSAALDRTLAQLREELGDQLRVVIKHYPLQRHPQAQLAAEASMAARAQDKFRPYHQRLFEERKDLSRPVLLRLAKELGLDLDRFRTDLERGRFAAAVRADHDEGWRWGLPGTPSLFLNGRFVGGSFSKGELRQKIEEEQRRAQELLRAGVRPADLYDHLIAAGRPLASIGARHDRSAPGS